MKTTRKKRAHRCRKLKKAIELSYLSPNLLNDRQVMIHNRDRRKALLLISHCPFCGKEL